MIFLFWAAFALLIWSLLGYGLVWFLLAKFVKPQRPVGSGHPLSVTMLIAARNEEAAIAAKLKSVLAQDVSPHSLNVVVVSDGSEDGTLAEALSVNDVRVTAFQTEDHGGKAQALNAGLAKVSSDVVIFSDANSILTEGAISALLCHFADENVGGVCGQPTPDKKSTGWLAYAEKVFWIYDSGLKYAESALGGAVSAQGTLYAIRKKYLPASVPETMADDFFISVQVPALGARLVFEPAAVAVEEVSDRTSDEFMRRVRSTERGWRGLMKMRRLMNPMRYGLYAVQLFSHKFLRRFAAFLLPLFLISNLALIDDGSFFVVCFILQTTFYLLALLGIISKQFQSLPGVKIATFFVMGHFAMAVGILRALFGWKSARWSPVRTDSR